MSKFMWLSEDNNIKHCILLKIEKNTCILMPRHYPRQTNN